MATTRRGSGRRLLLPLALLALALSLAACGPEADRERGGGEGADIGNHGDEVQLHGGDPAIDRIYYRTPRELQNPE